MEVYKFNFKENHLINIKEICPIEELDSPSFMTALEAYIFSLRISFMPNPKEVKL
ncbi:MAG: hypothetical protein SVN78_02090 [Deferribacterota bacterium]|nr:hypothetical protein [Deferribacterota bacterium]